MRSRCLWLVFMVCACTGPARGQEPRWHPDLLEGLGADNPWRPAESFLESAREGFGSSLQSTLEVFRGGVDALSPSYLSVTEGIESGTEGSESGTEGIVASFLDIWREEGVRSHLTVGKADNWQSGLAYMFVTCPHGTFPSRENAGVRVSYDDSRLWATTLPSFKGLQPSATMGFETNDRLRRVMDSSMYLQLGINPGYELKLPGNYPVVASLPVTLGLNSEYDELARSSSPGFGYLDIGLTVSTPLSLKPERSGSWGVSAGVNFLFLGDGRRALNDGDDFEVIGSITFGFEF